MSTDPPDNGPRRRGLPFASWMAPLVLMLLALMLRAWALDWGVPNATHFYPFHPDEAVLLDVACRVNPLWGEVKTGFYNYGSFTVLLTRLVHDLVAPMLGGGAVPRFDQPFAAWVGDFGRLLLTGRWVTVVLGSLTIGLTVLLARRGSSSDPAARWEPWLAGLFLALAPLHVVLSHYLTVDVPATFFSTLVMVAAVQALREPRRLVLWLAVAGIALGLGTGTKYNTALVALCLLPPLVTSWRAGETRHALAGAGLCALLALVALVISTPGALQEPELLQRHVAYELGRNAEGQGLVFRATPPAALYHLGISLPVGLEWPLYLAALLGVGRALMRRRPEDWVLLLLIVPMFLSLAGAERKFVRYVTPLLPPLCVLAAWALSEGAACSRFGWLARGAAGVALLGAAASTVAHLGVMGAEDSRVAMVRRLEAETRPAEIIALAGDAWYYTPPFAPDAGCVKSSLAYGGPPAWDRVPEGQPRPDLMPWKQRFLLAPTSMPSQGPLKPAMLRQYRPRYVVVSDYEYEDAERARKADPGFQTEILVLLDALRDQGYQLQFEVRPRPSLAGLTWWSRGIPPHDWRYFMPGYRVYQRP